MRGYINQKRRLNWWCFFLMVWVQHMVRWSGHQKKRITMQSCERLQVLCYITAPLLASDVTISLSFLWHQVAFLCFFLYLFFSPFPLLLAFDQMCRPLRADLQLDKNQHLPCVFDVLAVIKPTCAVRFSAIMKVKLQYDYSRKFEQIVLLIDWIHEKKGGWWSIGTKKMDW